MNELKKHLGDNKEKITKAKNIMHAAEAILQKEKGDWHIIIPSAIIYEVDIVLAQKMLLACGLKKDDMDEMLNNVKSVATNETTDSSNINILFDAVWLTKIKAEFQKLTAESLKTAIDKTFRTPTAKSLATQRII